MSDLELEQHRDAWRAVVGVFPESAHISHGVNFEADWDVAEIELPPPLLFGPKSGCPRCGDPKTEKGLNTPGVVEKILCRDWHDICQCGAPYGQPKNEGCLRQKRRTEEGSVPAHPKVEK